MQFDILGSETPLPSLYIVCVPSSGQKHQPAQKTVVAHLYACVCMPACSKFSKDHTDFTVLTKTNGLIDCNAVFFFALE